MNENPHSLFTVVSVGKKSQEGRGFRQIVALEHVRRRLFCLLAASVRAPDKTGHFFCGLKSKTAKAERFEDGSRT